MKMLRTAVTKPSILFSGFLFTEKTFVFPFSILLFLSYSGLFNIAVLCVTPPSHDHWPDGYFGNCLHPQEKRRGETQVLSLSYGCNVYELLRKHKGLGIF